MGKLKSCGHCLIIGFNIFFMILGLIFVVAGFLLEFSSILEDLVGLDAPYNDMLTDLEKENDDQNIYFRDITVFTNLVVSFIVLGSILITIAILGTIGVCCKNRTLLFVYALVMVAILAGEIILIIVLAGTQMKTFEDAFLNTLEKFQGLDSYNIESRTWNAIMIKGCCCGVKGYEDFEKKAKDWDFKLTYGNGTKISVEIPAACCEPPTKANVENGCTNSSSSANNKDVGCLDKFFGIEKYSMYFIPAAALILLFQLTMVICSFYLCRKMGKKSTRIGFKRKR